jgi:hypothetical protein
MHFHFAGLPEIAYFCLDFRRREVAGTRETEGFAGNAVTLFHHIWLETSFLSAWPRYLTAMGFPTFPLPGDQ